VVSGVGGQYNFVAMAHALPDARSILMLRASREANGHVRTSIPWNYPHTTIPRHLRDLYVTEYGIADVRGRADEDCVIAMAAIADARFQDELIATAKSNGKLRADFAVPVEARRNTTGQLRGALSPFRADGTLPDYPLGSDFTAVEQRLVTALGWLKTNTQTRGGKLRTLLRALTAGRIGDAEAAARMGLSETHGAGEWIESRLLSLALRATRR
jgi:hypothetical protein